MDFLIMCAVVVYIKEYQASPITPDMNCHNVPRLEIDLFPVVRNEVASN